MAHFDANHRFFSTENIKNVTDGINARFQKETGKTIHFVPNDVFVDQMILAAHEYPHFLLTADPQEGIAQLNDVLVRRAMRAMTETDTAGQYVAGNVLYRQTHVIRRDDDGFDDPIKQGAGVTLAGNIYRKHNAEFQARQMQIRNEYLNNPYNDRFTATVPIMTLDSDFRDL
jgi:hypothetical protein